MPYLAVFLAALAVDSVPVFAPPAWTLITLLVARFDLNAWAAAAIGAAGSTLGRFFLSRYLPKLSRRFLSQRRNENVAYAGRQLDRGFRRSFLFVLAYAMTPLSTTALFTAVGMARANPLPILPAFFLGKFAADATLIITSGYAITHFSDIAAGMAEPKTIVAMALGCLLILGVFLLDWRQLLEHRRLRFSLRRPGSTPPPKP